MLLSNIIEKIGMPFEIIDEKPVKSLGLLSYNSGDCVCTFIEKSDFLKSVPDNISMIITKREVAESINDKEAGYGMIVTENPRVMFFLIHNFLSKTEDYKRHNFETVIGKDCSISKLAYIAENNVVIGKNVTVEEFVSIKENTVIGDNSVIRAGTVIGGTGFEFKKTDDGRSILVEHIGGVKIGDNVEIQYNTCVDKAIYPWDDTIIGDYSSIDNLVHVAHGVKLGKLNYVVAGAKIGGRCIIGDNAWIGLGALIRNGIKIGDNARANMGAVVTKSIDDNSAVSGNFAIRHDKFIEKLKKSDR